MRLFFAAAVLLGSGAMAVSQTDRLNTNTVAMSAIQISTENGIRQLRGKVRIETPSFVLTADEASFNLHAHDIYARGNVHVTLK